MPDAGSPKNSAKKSPANKSPVKKSSNKQPQKASANRKTQSAALRELFAHPYLAMLGAIATAATLFGLGFSVGSNDPPEPTIVTPPPTPPPEAPEKLEAAAFGSILVDGRKPSSDEVGQLTLYIKECSISEAVSEPEADTEADIDVDGRFEIRGLPVEPQGTCYQPVARLGVDKQNEVFGEQVTFNDENLSAQFGELQVVSQPPECQNDEETLALRFVESGVLSSTARAEAAQVAINEIRETSGALSQIQYDEVTINDPPTGEQIAEMANDCVDALITHLGSATSELILPDVAGQGIIQFSPNSTSPDLIESDEDDGLFFRTAPSDEIQARKLAIDLETNDKVSAAVVYLNDSYGRNLKELFEASFEGGGNRQRVIAEYEFSLGETIRANRISELLSAEPDSIVVIGYARESAQALELLNENGFDSSSIWLVDGNADVADKLDDPSILAGARQTVPGAEPTGDALISLRQRLDLAPGEPLATFAAQTYDAVIILALAAEAATPGDAMDIAAQINEVTKTGERCTTYSECLALIENAVNIDYDGVGGPYEFTDDGEPFRAFYRIDVYGQDGRPDPQLSLQGDAETLCEICRLNDLQVDFQEGSAEIDQRYDDELTQIASIIVTSDIEVAIIEGYASTSGSVSANQQLSLRRAEAVRDHLISNEGVPQEKLKAVGMGSTDEFIENRTVLFSS